MKSMKEFREESNGQTRVLYHLNYWDGPISGMCLYNGKLCYFDVVDEIITKTYMNDIQWFSYCVECLRGGYKIDDEDRTDQYEERVYGIFETPDDVVVEIEESHNLFRNYVGTHCDYDYNSGCRTAGAKALLKDDHGKFYNNPKKKNFCKMDVKNWTVLDKFIHPF